MTHLTILDDIIGVVAVTLFVGVVLWLIQAVRPFRHTFLMHYDHDACAMVRVPRWRLSVLVGALAGLGSGGVFALLAAY